LTAVDLWNILIEDRKEGRGLGATVGSLMDIGDIALVFALIVVVSIVIYLNNVNKRKDSNQQNSFFEQQEQENEQESLEPISIEQRQEILEEKIIEFTQQGWRVNNRTETSAQLVRDKKANCLVAVLLFTLGIVPGILYLAIYPGTNALYVSVNQCGKVHVT
jgi:uncharacterized membrane protein YhiD involved in acid resistance